MAETFHRYGVQFFHDHEKLAVWIPRRVSIRGRVLSVPPVSPCRHSRTVINHPPGRPCLAESAGSVRDDEVGEDVRQGDGVVAVRLGDRGVRQPAGVRVQAAGQGGVGTEGGAPAAASPVRAFWSEAHGRFEHCAMFGPVPGSDVAHSCDRPRRRPPAGGCENG